MLLLKHSPYSGTHFSILLDIFFLVIMPVVSLVFVNILQMSTNRSLILLILGSCPGGTISNGVVVWIDGDVDMRYCISQT